MLPFFKYKFLCYLSFHLEGHLSAFLERQAKWWWISNAFVCLGKCLSHLISEGLLCWMKYSWSACFSFSTLSISFHSLLAREISAEKSADKIMGFPCKLQALFFMFLLRFSLWKKKDFLFDFWPIYYMQYVLERISVSWFCQMAYEHHELGCSTLSWCGMFSAIFL